MAPWISPSGSHSDRQLLLLVSAAGTLPHDFRLVEDTGGAGVGAGALDVDGRHLITPEKDLRCRMLAACSSSSSFSCSMLLLSVVGPAPLPPFLNCPNGAFLPLTLPEGHGTPAPPRHRSWSEQDVRANSDRKKARDACSLARTAFPRPSARALAGCAPRTSCDCCSGATVAVLLLPPLPAVASA